MYIDNGKTVKISAYLYGSHILKFDFDLYIPSEVFEESILTINSYADELIANMV